MYVFLGCRETSWKGPRPWAWQGPGPWTLNVGWYLFFAVCQGISMPVVLELMFCALLVRLEGIRSLLVRLLCSASVLVKQ